MPPNAPTIPRSVRAYGPAPYVQDYIVNLDRGRDVRPLLSVCEKRACLLIGEPGSGKTHSLNVIRHALRTSAPPPLVQFVDLRQIHENIIDRDVFDPAAAAISDTGQFLILDSLDECKIRIDRFVPLLQRRLTELVLRGLRVIATCRTSELSNGLINLFVTLGGDEAVRQLLPLDEEQTHSTCIYRKRTPVPTRSRTGCPPHRGLYG
jgi:hypothetical protein